MLLLWYCMHRLHSDSPTLIKTETPRNINQTTPIKLHQNSNFLLLLQCTLIGFSVSDFDYGYKECVIEYTILSHYLQDVAAIYRVTTSHFLLYLPNLQYLPLISSRYLSLETRNSFVCVLTLLKNSGLIIRHYPK